MSNHHHIWVVILSDYMQGKVILLFVLLDPLLTTTSALSAAWNGEYRGSNHRLLLTNINKMKRNTPYSNSVTILQSSGTGKSRMVHELSELVFTLPFNLRLHAESKGYSLLWCIYIFLFIIIRLRISSSRCWDTWLSWLGRSWSSAIWGPLLSSSRAPFSSRFRRIGQAIYW